LKGIDLSFVVIPSEDCHLDCEPSKFEWSKNGIPYPKLEVFAQSLLDTYSLVDLTDLVDGMDLTEEWGSAHLDLSGTNDIAWATQKNERIRVRYHWQTTRSCLSWVKLLGIQGTLGRTSWEQREGELVSSYRQRDMSQDLAIEGAKILHWGKERTLESIEWIVGVVAVTGVAEFYATFAFPAPTKPPSDGAEMLRGRRSKVL
jgi:hypothetical protein